MQSFLGKFNFLRRFTSDFEGVVKHLQEMIKKDSNFKWTKVSKEAFKKIKEVIIEATTLQSPNFDRFFILYTFSSNHSIVDMLMQKDEFREELLVSFIIMWLEGSKLVYPNIDKQAFVILKVVKHFRPYLLRSHTKIIGPNSVVRSLLIQKETGYGWGN